MGLGRVQFLPPSPLTPHFHRRPLDLGLLKPEDRVVPGSRGRWVSRSRALSHPMQALPRLHPGASQPAHRRSRGCGTTVLGPHWCRHGGRRGRSNPPCRTPCCRARCCSQKKLRASMGPRSSILDCDQSVCSRGSGSSSRAAGAEDHGWTSGKERKCTSVSDSARLLRPELLCGRICCAWASGAAESSSPGETTLAGIQEMLEGVPEWTEGVTDT